MIDQIFNKYKTKFSVLNSLAINKPNTKKVAVYINIEMILKSVFTERVNQYAMNLGDDNDVKISIVSNIINLAQHYRWYFIKNGYDCEAFIYWNYPVGKYLNYMHNENYRTYYNNKTYHSSSCTYLNKCFKDSMETTKMIASRMNGVNIITNNIIESSVIPYIIHSDYYHGDNSIQHIIVSNDKYDFQYVNNGFTIIVPRQEDTIIVNSSNVIDILKKSFNIKSESDIPVKHLVFALSIIGCKYRNLSKIAGVGLGSIIKIINTAIDKVLITENTTSVQSFCSLINNQYKDQFISNYNCIDVQKQYSILTPLNIHEVLSCIHDKYDDNTLDLINDRFFQKHPLLTFHNHKQALYNDNNTNIFDKR